MPGYPEDTVDELEIALDNATQIPDGEYSRGLSCRCNSYLSGWK